MDKSDLMEVFILSERLHRQFLDAIQLELDVRNIRDLNSVRALMLLNIGESEMTASELLWRGCYLGSNVSYNLKKTTEAGYIIQERSKHDKRVIMVRNSAKGVNLCAMLQEMNARHIRAMAKGDFEIEDMTTCSKTLRTLQSFLSRAKQLDRTGLATVTAVSDPESARAGVGGGAPASPPSEVVSAP